MKKKSLFMMLVTICLIGVIGVGATLAYLSDTTDQLTNTFTLGKTDIEIDEPHWKGNPEDIVPGQSFDKDPTVTVIKNSVDSYVFMSVKGIDKMYAAGFEIDGINSAWKKAVDFDNDYENDFDGIYVYVGATNDPMIVKKANDDNELEPLFEKVTYGTSNTETQGGEFKILVKAAAVQATGEDGYDYTDALAVVRTGLETFE